MSAPYLSVIVPCYNERENLVQGVLQELHTYLSAQDYSYEVIISDDGSSDNSRELVREQIQEIARFRLLCNEHGGKPIALWHGIQAARGELLLFTDMDQSTPIDQLAKLMPAIESGYDIAIGSRGSGRHDFPLHRQLGSAIFRRFRQLFLLSDIVDTQCGFKLLRADIARELFPLLEAIREPSAVKGWRVTAFDVELLALAKQAAYTIQEIPVEWSNRDVAQGKGKSYLGESWEMLQQIVRVKCNQWRGYYELPSRGDN